MTGWIVGAVAAGMLAGHFVLPAEWAAHCALITWGCASSTLVGVDWAPRQCVGDIRQAGARVLAIRWRPPPEPWPRGRGWLFLPMSVKDAMAASAGFGWYSLAPMLLADYSPSVSAVAFLSNVMREVFAIVLIPILARRVGYLECVGVAGATAMDTVLPVVVRAPAERIAIYSFVSGVVLSFAVPVVVPAVVALPF
jgi:hypothetical protein